MYKVSRHEDNNNIVVRNENNEIIADFSAENNYLYYGWSEDEVMKNAQKFCDAANNYETAVTLLKSVLYESSSENEFDSDINRFLNNIGMADRPSYLD